MIQKYINKSATGSYTTLIIDTEKQTLTTTIYYDLTGKSNTEVKQIDANKINYNYINSRYERIED